MAETQVSPKVIEASWEVYKAATGLIEAPAVQLTEMKRAYFAGAISFYSEIMSVLSPGAEPTNGDVLKLGSMVLELKQFATKVKRGEA
jgi:hypothetical protein